MFKDLILVWFTFVCVSKLMSKCTIVENSALDADYIMEKA
jgi:hypothetical protein